MKKKIGLFTTIIIVLVLLVACIHNLQEDDLVVDTINHTDNDDNSYVKHVIKEEEEGSIGFFWELKKDNTIVYLLGSVHSGVNEMYPLRAEIMEAFRVSDYLVLELDISNETITAKGLEEIQYLSDGITLSEFLSHELVSKLEDILPNYHLNMEQVSNLKPWFIHLLLETKRTEVSNYDFGLGIEEYLLSIKKEEIEVIGLESELAFKKLDLLPLSDQEYLLQRTISDIQLSEELDLRLDLWINGDFDEFSDWVFDTFLGVPELKLYNKLLLDDRNMLMVERIEDFLSQESKTYFVVIGAAHFVGEHSILNLLTNKGYEVIRK